MRLGCHVERAEVLGQARESGSDVVQVFLSPPRSWSSPRPRGDEAEIAAASVEVFVHASYLANPSSLNPEVRAKARRHLMEVTDAAALVGASGVVVHGGHPTGSGTVLDGVRNWVEVLSGWEPKVRILVENTAGGSSAVARRFSDFAVLLDSLRSSGFDVGVCLDTCHAHAGGEDLLGVVERLSAFAGRIDFVHVNDSRDEFDSGRDRHANLGAGLCDLDAIVAAVAEAGSPAVVETPNGLAAMSADVGLLRSRLGIPYAP